MNSITFSVFFVAFLLLTLCVQFWLGSRHIRHILRHRTVVPARFAQKIALPAHQKAADYSIAKTKLSLLSLLFNGLVLIGFTLFGGLQWLSVHLLELIGSGMLYQIALLAAFVVISSVLELPFSYYTQFVLEQKFGFNKMTPALFFGDMIKNSALGCAIGLPLIWVVLSLMEQAGANWWLYAWLVWSGFQLLMMSIYPSVIAPLFNKFTPLDDAALRTRIENLMQRVGFASKGLFVMDGSKRSAHGNAYFSGFGAGKRIVFFDTLLARLAPQEIEAVLAHELGHFKLKHIVKRMLVIFTLSLGFLALLGFLKQQVWFYTGLGVDPMLLAKNDAMALILFLLCIPVFGFLFSPLSAISSRRHEFEADAFAAKHTNANDLVAALVKLYEDNAATLTPDPLYSSFYDSHPPATVRIDHLLAAH
ncbi:MULTISPECIES: M48 family metallopeptidase [unclassified Undibacterium]|uniref:M48 family metallopeptidase n=1 Tax=unclassified Undibacterium TaxID=2630295 RepID=UPI002AC97710|nr:MULTISPECIES: M48 family metallopeptidase [unclassified Undibacterium]MEB0138404.1 M48 family metallopeptidase [Undibacterium sp. CCC2.1]MEB0171279.1 M48 family metallopeptidase [Undibacterium sp. CCC1.1]MEB0176483.1 M48 family metallopeptidase [Undibacterium sp. CCC3.4]MEB0214033.1 M48 family metallopeptidase [Undibacterium sp. 5I2]WPX43648.1 M48 family metallopeptidase [Undibacterium sp. CCC3.4]